MIIAVNSETAKQGRGETALENIFEDADGSDGLGTFMLRMGPGMQTTGPEPRLTGGQFFLVLNGSLRYEEADYPIWSTVYAGPADVPLRIAAGNQGLEALVLNFPRLQA